MPEVEDVEEEDANSEFNAETELIMPAYSLPRTAA
jgi:hypothetical protein